MPYTSYGLSEIKMHIKVDKDAALSGSKLWFRHFNLEAAVV